MNYLHACSVLAVFAGVVGAALVQAQSEPSEVPVRTHEEFSFVASSGYAVVFPLFGAHKERVWATGFDPQFVYPVPPHDEVGMVFATVQDDLSRVWVNTAFDASTGHVQYVYWIADVMTALIDIQVTNSGGPTTSVHVVYERTALRPDANERVRHMAHLDANSGPHWANMINGYLATAAVE
jgi:hypothetical protein